MQVAISLSIPRTHIKLGDRARDVVSGFVGIVTTHGRHLTGCDSVWLTGEVDKEGKVKEKFVHLAQLELVDSNPLDCTRMPEEVPAAG